MCFQNLLKTSACSQLTYLLSSHFHQTRYSIIGRTPCLLVTRSTKIFFTFSREASDGCSPLHFRCLECFFLLPIEFTFPSVTLSMCVQATSVRSLFNSFSCTLDSKEVLGVLGFRLTWRAPSSCIKPICALSSCSLSLKPLDVFPEPSQGIRMFPAYLPLK